MKEGIERIFIKESGAKIGIISGWGSIVADFPVHVVISTWPDDIPWGPGA